MSISILEVYEICELINNTVNILEAQPDLTSQSIQALESLVDGEATNDLEILLTDLNNNLQYVEYDPNAESISSLTYMAKRLDVIDARLDTEFVAFNDGFSLLLGAVMFFVGWTFFKSIFHRIENA